MTIIHKIDNFIFELFPKSKEAGNDIEILQRELEKFYTLGPYKPSISVKDDFIEIKIEGNLIGKHGRKFQDIIKLCEAGKLDQAKQKIKPLIQEAPHVSEYYRILGQIQSDQGQQEEAIDTLIDALRWDPKNEWALIMMGNIFARHKDDIPTAMKYYEQAAKNNPKDNIALNNIGANLMQLGKTKEALGYFQKALKLNPDYPNTHYALAMLADMEDNHQSAFKNALTALRKNSRKDVLYQNSLKTAIYSAKQLMNHDEGLAIVQAYATKLEFECGKSITIQEDPSIPTAAKIEFAETYEREGHIIKYKPEHASVHHLVMHELVHLDLASQARQKGNNQLFIKQPE